MKFPASVKNIKQGIDEVRSSSYNLLQNMKIKAAEEEKKKLVGKEGKETIMTDGKKNEKKYAEMHITDAELEKYLKI